tara:strand:- start:556 stop:1290 length:735 start_codon:yes stop_codon:yes gene_type:complete
MSDMQRDEKNTDIAVAEDLKPILSVLGEEDSKAIAVLRDELVDNWKKKQIFRTETEMRISVLNDAKHPTDASKYWQSVREMGAMFDALMGLSFDLRRNDLKQEKLHRKLLKAQEKGDDLKERELQIDIDQNLWEKANMRSTAHDRVRELRTWSKIKDELDNGTFDNQNVDAHQAVSYTHTLANRVKSLSEHSQPAEIVNAAGPLQTVQRLMTKDGRLKQFDGKVPELPVKEKEPQLTDGEEKNG